MINYLQKYNSQAPRYTSYPTAPHFNSTINSQNYVDFLRTIPNGETLSLYIHIPFCKQLCWYCGCFTKATQRYAPVKNYINILAQEIKIVAELIAKDHQISHIHFGGGSPTILAACDIDFLFEIIKKNFLLKKDCEIAIEIDPRNVDEEKIISYAKNGVNRASIGVQDFNHEVQKAINRIQSFAEVYDCIENLRKFNIKNINLDLIYGLPKQTAAMVERNIELSMQLKPTRIALFSYAHVQWIKKHMRLIEESDLADAQEKSLMYEKASKKLEENGFYAIGLDHFAQENDSMFQFFKTKKLKRNFQGYSTDEGSNIIGFGVSAISFVNGIYGQNTTDFLEYEKEISAQKLPIKKGIKLSDEDKIRKEIIDEIMCYLEIDLEKICRKYNLPNSYFANEIKALHQLEKDKLIKINHQKILINQNFRQISRIVCSFFDQYLNQQNKQYSKIA